MAANLEIKKLEKQPCGSTESSTVAYRGKKACTV